MNVRKPFANRSARTRSRSFCMGKTEALVIRVFVVSLCPYESEVDLAHPIVVASLHNLSRGDRCTFQLILVVGLKRVVELEIGGREPACDGMDGPPLTLTSPGREMEELLVCPITVVHFEEAAARP